MAATDDPAKVDVGDSKKEPLNEPHAVLSTKPKEVKRVHEVILTSPAVTALLTVSLGTILGGFLLEKAKQDTLAIDKAKQKQEATIKNQQLVLESINTLLIEYRAAAVGMAFEVLGRQGAELTGDAGLQEARKLYDASAKVLSIGLDRDLFRIRMYFNDDRVYTSLKEKIGKLLKIEVSFAQLITSYRKQGGGSVSTADQEKWAAAVIQLRETIDEMGSLLNQLVDETVTKN